MALNPVITDSGIPSQVRLQFITEMELLKELRHKEQVHLWNWTTLVPSTSTRANVTPSEYFVYIRNREGRTWRLVDIGNYCGFARDLRHIFETAEIAWSLKILCNCPPYRFLRQIGQLFRIFGCSAPSRLICHFPIVAYSTVAVHEAHR